jgi:hypothetical protein
MLTVDNTVLLIVDVQGNLAHLMHEKEHLFENKCIGLEKIRDAGAHITSVETALFELLGTAEGDRFKRILEIVK